MYDSIGGYKDKQGITWLGQVLLTKEEIWHCGWGPIKAQDRLKTLGLNSKTENTVLSVKAVGPQEYL